MPHVNALITGNSPQNFDFLVHGLAAAGVRAVDVELQEAAREKSVRGHKVDIVIVDLVEFSSELVQACSEVAAHHECPVLVMGYDRDERVQLRFYRAGMAEYIVKPISMALLLAKITTWLRRIQAPKQAERRALEHFRVNAARRFVTTPEGQRVRLSKLEYRLFEILHTNSGRVLPPNLLADRIYGDFEEGDGRLKHLVLRLRRKIEPDPSAPRYIETVGQDGYSLRSLGQAAQPM